MTINCLVCSHPQEADSPAQHVCECGSRAFRWDDGQTKPRQNYDTNWGRRFVEPA